MKLSLTNKVVKQIVEGCNNKKLKYAVGGILDNILIITYDAAAIYKAEVNSDFTDYLSRVKQPAADYHALLHFFESMEKYNCMETNYDQCFEVTHQGDKLLCVIYNSKKYYFDPKYLNQFKSTKKYNFEFFIYGSYHGINVYEYVPADDMYDHIAIIMGVKT